MSDRTIIAMWILALTNLFVFLIGAAVLCSNSGEPMKWEYVPVQK